MVGVYHKDIGLFDFTQREEQFRRILVGRDDCVSPQYGASQRLAATFGQIEDISHLGKLVHPYLESTKPGLHCALVNWHDHRIETEWGDCDALLADGLRNVTAHGNVNMRRLASAYLSSLRCLGRFHDGDAGLCRIIWGSIMSLGDCAGQQLAIGNLHFQAIDYGGAIHINDFAQQRSSAIEMDERNQRKLLALPDGLGSANAARKIPPPGVAQCAPRLGYAFRNGKSITHFRVPTERRNLPTKNRCKFTPRYRSPESRPCLPKLKGHPAPSHEKEPTRY